MAGSIGKRASPTVTRNPLQPLKYPAETATSLSAKGMQVRSVPNSASHASQYLEAVIVLTRWGTISIHYTTQKGIPRGLEGRELINAALIISMCSLFVSKYRVPIKLVFHFRIEFHLGG